MTNALFALFNMLIVYICLYVLYYMCSYNYFHIFGLMEYESKLTVQILKDQLFVYSWKFHNAFVIVCIYKSGSSNVVGKGWQAVLTTHKLVNKFWFGCMLPVAALL